MLPATYLDTEHLESTGRRRRLGRTEIERREPYMVKLCQKLTPHHPLVQLTKSCLEDEPEDRPSTDEVLQRLESLQLDNPYCGMTRLDIIRELEALKVSVATDSKDQEITTLQQQVRQSFLTVVSSIDACNFLTRAS